MNRYLTFLFTENAFSRKNTRNILIELASSNSIMNPDIFVVVLFLCTKKELRMKNKIFLSGPLGTL